MRLFGVVSSKSLAGRVRLSLRYTDRYIQDAPITGDGTAG
jgi:hypothetical protein